MNLKDFNGQEAATANSRPKQQRSKSEEAIGIDLDEQAMNGLYGEPESNTDNRNRGKN